MLLLLLLLLLLLRGLTGIEQSFHSCDQPFRQRILKTDRQTSVGWFPVLVRATAAFVVSTEAAAVRMLTLTATVTSMLPLLSLGLNFCR
jgi:hypothetical protein